MKKLMMTVLSCGMMLGACAQTAALKAIELNEPSLDRGKPVMQALSERRSTREFADRMLSLQDLSDLVWAANGINRPESGKRTAPSAMNRQDVKVYVCTRDGSYLYDPAAAILEPLTAGDVRPDGAPVCIVLVTDEGETWSALDAGIVSQNISLFCAGAGLATYPRASMDRDALRQALQLSAKQELMLCHPVGYFK
ncbi:MAG: SagB/ThcOx family dehydrogenase [Rikenellaceae bacterium]|nr:SagB/ThcOx family dehydrogenase [Rikenellaceae bacterium]